MRRLISAAVALAVHTALAATAFAQTPPPVPGPTNPNPPTPSASGEKTIVINPTLEECRRGWVSTAQWTKEQFDQLCSKLQTSK